MGKEHNEDPSVACFLTALPVAPNTQVLIVSRNNCSRLKELPEMINARVLVATSTTDAQSGAIDALLFHDTLDQPCMNEIDRVLSPQGKVCFTFKNNKGLLNFIPRWRKLAKFSEGSLPIIHLNHLRSSLMKRGYKVVQIYPWPSHTYIRRLNDSFDGVLQAFESWGTKRFLTKPFVFFFRSLFKCFHVDILSSGYAVIASRSPHSSPSLLQTLVSQESSPDKLPKSVALSTTGTLLLTTEKSFIKVPLTHSADAKVRAEHANIMSLLEKFPHMAHFICRETVLKTYESLATLSLPLLSPWSPINAELDSKFLEGYTRAAQCHSRKANLPVDNLFPLTRHWLLGDDELTVNIERWVKQFHTHPWLLGPLHGDLHPGNVMMDRSGNIKIIDWDRFRPRWVLACDPLHYQIYSRMRREGISWRSAVTKLMNEANPANYESNLFYVLNRIESDMEGVAHSDHLPKFWHTEMLSTLEICFSVIKNNRGQ